VCRQQQQDQCGTARAAGPAWSQAAGPARCSAGSRTSVVRCRQQDRRGAARAAGSRSAVRRRQQDQRNAARAAGPARCRQQEQYGAARAAGAVRRGVGSRSGTARRGTGSGSSAAWHRQQGGAGKRASFQWTLSFRVYIYSLISTRTLHPLKLLTVELFLCLRTLSFILYILTPLAIEIISCGFCKSTSYYSMWRCAIGIYMVQLASYRLLSTR